MGIRCNYILPTWCNQAYCFKGNSLEKLLQTYLVHCIYLAFLPFCRNRNRPNVLSYLRKYNTCHFLSWQTDCLFLQYASIYLSIYLSLLQWWSSLDANAILHFSFIRSLYMYCDISTALMNFGIHFCLWRKIKTKRLKNKAVSKNYNTASIKRANHCSLSLYLYSVENLNALCIF